MYIQGQGVYQNRDYTLNRKYIRKDGSYCIHEEMEWDERCYNKRIVGMHDERGFIQE